MIGGEHERRRLDEGARARPVRRVVEDDAFADRFADAEGHEAHRPRVVALLDRDRAAGDDRHEVARRSFVEQQLVGGEDARLDQLGEMVQRALRRSLKEAGCAQPVAIRRGGCHGVGKLNGEREGPIARPGRDP